MMTEKRRYKTRPRQLITNLLREHASEFLTAEEIHERLKAEGYRVGLTTVYRTLSELLDSERAVKVPSPQGRGTAYRYIAESQAPSPYGKLQCRSCGETQSLACSELDKFFSHIEADHNFHVSRPATLFVGECAKCSAAEAELASDESEKEE